MKAGRYLKRDRTTPGRATGTVLCHLTLPVTGAKCDRRINGNRERVIEKIRNFVDRHLPQDPDLQKDASLVIQAEVRAASGGLRRTQLAKWKAGDQLDLILDKAAAAWAELELEEDYSRVDVEI